LETDNLTVSRKGKPAERPGRKAKGLEKGGLAAEGSPEKSRSFGEGTAFFVGKKRKGKDD